MLPFGNLPPCACLREQNTARCHINVIIFVRRGSVFLNSSYEVMSASDSPGLLAGNPPFAVGCPG